MPESHIIDMMKAFAEMKGLGERQLSFFKWKYENAKLLKNVRTDDIAQQYPEIKKYLKTHRRDIVMKQCYKNAAQLCLYVPNVEYVEGEISFHGIPLDHAWNKIDGKYFDITKDMLFKDAEDYAEYVSVIELDPKELIDFMHQTGTYGGFLREKYIKDNKIDESYYPKLFESPDHIDNESHDAHYNWDDKDAFPFGYMNGELFVGKSKESHDSMKINAVRYDRYEFKYPGRIWLKGKIVSFWEYPPTKEKLKEILDGLSSKLGIEIWSDPLFRIEVVKRKANDKVELFAQEDQYGRQESVWDLPSRSHKDEIIKVKDYIKSENPPEVQHLVPPGAGKKPVISGYGSKNPKYSLKRRWQMATLGDESLKEPFYPHLFEKLNKRPKKILTFPALRQVFNYDCGASALQAVLCYYGIEVREEYILKKLEAKHTDIFNNGVHLSAIKSYSESKGLEANVISNLTYTDLINYIKKDIPVIVLLQAWKDSKSPKRWKDDYRDGHYVVAIGYTDDSIIFEDPSSFERTYLKFKELMKRWHAVDDNNEPRKETECIVIVGKPKFDPKKIVHMD